MNKKETKEEIIEINDDLSISEESKRSEPYKKKIIQNKSIDKKGKKSITKKIKESQKNPEIKNIEIKINNKSSKNTNLSFSSNNNDKGNFSQVLFDYKNFVENKKPNKRKKDLKQKKGTKKIIIKQG